MRNRAFTPASLSAEAQRRGRRRTRPLLAFTLASLGGIGAACAIPLPARPDATPASAPADGGATTALPVAGVVAGVEVRVKYAGVDFLEMKTKEGTEAPPAAKPVADAPDDKSAEKPANPADAPAEPATKPDVLNLTDQRLFIIRLEFRNSGTSDVTYTSYNGSGAGKNDYATLVEVQSKKYLPIASFDKFEAVGAVHQVTIKPGQSVSDVLGFAAPTKFGASKYALYLSEKNFGGKGKKPVAIPIELAAGAGQ